MNQSEKITMIYLLAASHSGSTLTAFLLGSHENICTIGEIKASSLGDPEKYLCSCRCPILRCMFWKDVAVQMKLHGVDFSVANADTNIADIDDVYIKRILSPLHRGRALEMVRDGMLMLSPRWKKHYSRIKENNYLLMRSIAKVTGKSVVVDSSKIGIRLKYLLRDSRINVKVVRVVRDGRGVALTYIDPSQYADAKDPAFRGGGAGGYAASRRATIREAATEWRRSNEEAENVVSGLAEDQWIQIKYEDLCRDTDSELAKVFDFIGVDPQKRVKDFKSVEHHVIGNGMRLDNTSEIRLDERWRDVFTSSDIAEFDEVAGDLNRKYGYK